MAEMANRNNKAKLLDDEVVINEAENINTTSNTILNTTIDNGIKDSNMIVDKQKQHTKDLENGKKYAKQLEAIKERSKLQNMTYCASGCSKSELEDFKKYLKDNKLSFTQFTNNVIKQLTKNKKNLTDFIKDIK